MATVIKLVNDLIGKEDIAWGDASTTFSRETYTGGTTSITYIDDTVIPATALGGYIGDHLHAQNTDTGTTATTFDINSAGSRARLSSSGLTANRTFTFPDGSDQELVGATDLASVAASNGASLVGVQDSGGYFSGANVETVLQEIGSDVSTLESSTHNSGMKNGFKLGYSSTTAITISGGMWAHNGTTDQHVYTTSQITFTLGPAGSNASSSNLSADEVHYIYIDDSAVVAAATRLMTASEFINSTTAPSWSQSKVGWYNSNDRCIGAVLTDGSNNILAFRSFGKHYYRYDAPIEEFALAAAGTTYAALDLSSAVPAFATMVRIQLNCQTTGTTFYIDVLSSAETPEVHVARNTLTIDVPTNASQNVYWYASAGNNTLIELCGYYTDEL